MSDVDRYTEVIRECVREMIDDDEAYEVMREAADANRAAWDLHEERLAAFQAEVDRRAVAFGEAFEQVMQLAAKAEA